MEFFLADSTDCDVAVDKLVITIVTIHHHFLHTDVTSAIEHSPLLFIVFINLDHFHGSILKLPQLS